MVATSIEEYPAALQLGKELQDAINGRGLKNLEIGIDGIYSRLLLSQKKRYAALQIGPDKKETRIVKGLDLVRREWCPLSIEIQK